jgi:hypothetical protein
MRQLNVKSKMLPPKAISLEQLPHLIPRAVAADFAVCHRRTLARAEMLGQLTPIRRGQNISYRRDQFLQWLGIELPEPALVSVAKRKTKGHRFATSPKVATGRKIRGKRGFLIQPDR